jgi:hypothetical protein
LEGRVPTVEDIPKSYEECLKEIEALRASEDYGNWGGQLRPNTGQELTGESLRMEPEFMDGWAKKFDGLFATKPAPTQE